MSTDAAKHLLDEFNNGNWDEVGAYFNDDFETFYEYLDKYNLVGQLDLDYVESDYENLILLKRLEKHKEECLKYICDNIITDVYPMNDGYYLHLRSRTELVELFRSEDSKNAAEHVLSEDVWDPYWDTTDDVYSDVIEDLNESSLNHLASYIVKVIGNEEFTLDDDYDDPLFQQFSEKQGTEGFFKITNENVMELIRDESAMKEMLKNSLADLKSELYALHNNSFNSAYSDEINDDVWHELSEFFDSNSFVHEEKTRNDGTKIYYEYLKIEDFPYYIQKFLETYKVSQWNDEKLTYHGVYISVLKYMMADGELSWLDFRVPDYPDWSRIKQNINDYLRDYI